MQRARLPRFAHLAAKTSYSLRAAVIRPRELAEAAAEAGMEAVGVADRDGLYGAVRVAQACGEVGVRPIFGTDLALDPGESRAGWAARRGRSGPARGPGVGPAWLDEDPARVTLLARTPAGYADLCRLVTAHHLVASRGEPRATWAQLEEWVGRGGLFVLLGDSSPVGRLLDAGRVEAAEHETRRWVELAGAGDVLVGVTHHRARGDDARARAGFALADRLGLRAVAHQEPRYLRPADARLADVVDAIRGQVPLAPRHVQRRNTEGYFKTVEELGAVFAERPDALANAAWAAERCEVDLGLGRLRVPDFTGDAHGPGAGSAGAGGPQRPGPGPRGAADAAGELRARCASGLHERYAAVSEPMRARLDGELEMIGRLGLAGYFLTVAEIVDRIREKGIMVACRGSAAGSLVAYCLRISDVDPVAHDLVFERFANPYRDELPDIDLDVESARREDVYRDLLERYGSDRVACVAMVETFKARSAIREVGKALGFPADEVDVLAKAFPHIRARDVKSALATLPELAGRNFQGIVAQVDGGPGGAGDACADVQLLFDLVERLDGLPRHLALHPSGVLLAGGTPGEEGLPGAGGSLRDLVPCERSAAGFAMAQFDKDDVEALGLCKLDVLAVRMLSAMGHAAEEARRVRGVEVRFEDVPWNDEPTYELIRSTRTLGMFQIESPGQRELLGRLQPERLGDLVVDISLFRPGPVKADMVGPYLAGRSRRRPVVDVHPLLAEALAETHGVIVYHEQVMRCIAAITGCDLAVADLVRRRLDDPDELPSLRAWVLAGCRERGIAPDAAQALWEALAQFASFGFCKAHAAAFAVPTYRSAWLKAHFCPELFAGLLTHDPGMYPRRLLLDDARCFGIAALPLDVNRSARTYRVERVPAAEAYARLGVGAEALPPGWRRAGSTPVPPAGFDFGADPDDPAQRFALRLALQDVAGIDDAMLDGVLAARPFTSLADLRRRAALSAPVAEALAHVGALDGLAPDRSRRDILLEVSERWSGLARHQPVDPGTPIQLGFTTAEGPAGLSGYSASEQVRAELEVLGVDASRHVVRFYDALLARLGVTYAGDLEQEPDGRRVRVAGAKVATQTPPVKSGQRVIFTSLDDGTGVSDSAFFEAVHDRCAATVFHSWLLVIEGRFVRRGTRGLSVTAERVWDLPTLHEAWRAGRLEDALRTARPGSEAARPAAPAAGTARAQPPRRLWHASGGSAGR